jgi:hypothetical protein
MASGVKVIVPVVWFVADDLHRPAARLQSSRNAAAPSVPSVISYFAESSGRTVPMASSDDRSSASRQVEPARPLDASPLALVTVLAASKLSAKDATRGSTAMIRFVMRYSRCCKYGLTWKGDSAPFEACSVDWWFGRRRINPGSIPDK